MAYIAFSDTDGVATGPVAPQADRLPDSGRTDRLSALEWSVVAIARNDGRGSLRGPGRMATALRVVFRGRNPRLADERLEALRRMAVLTWADGYTVPSFELRAFLAAGFTCGQYETLARSVGAAKARAAVQRGSARVAGPAHA